jgi:DNA-binding NarL/FixJ family response regulator
MPIGNRLDEGEYEKGKLLIALSKRELDVAELVSKGLRNNEIAEKLFISEQTVKNHIHNILIKTSSRDRVALVLYVISKNYHLTNPVS